MLRHTGALEQAAPEAEPSLWKPLAGTDGSYSRPSAEWAQWSPGGLGGPEPREPTSPCSWS